MHIGIVAGEASADLLGRGLMEALGRQHPGVRFSGVGGPRMVAAGLDPWYPAERLAVMGIAEVVGHLPGLLRLRQDLVRRFVAHSPDLFVGIDAPDFNLGLERRLRRAGIPVAHYVSPSVWAWRRYRVAKIGRSVDLMLTLFPFEAEFYARHGIKARYVGHPLADILSTDRSRPYETGASPVVAILPGSRASEVRYLASDFLRAAEWLRQRRPEVSFITPLVTSKLANLFRDTLARVAPDLPITLHEGRSHRVMAEADVVLTASGTATLEAMLIGRPMVVAYRGAWLTYQVVNSLLRIPDIALPNLLAGRRVVPEYIQDEATPENLGAALLYWLDHPRQVHDLTDLFAGLGDELRRDASSQAAAELLELVGVKHGLDLTHISVGKTFSPKGTKAQSHKFQEKQ